jgi:hypothetical protein
MAKLEPVDSYSDTGCVENSKINEASITSTGQGRKGKQAAEPLVFCT